MSKRVFHSEPAGFTMLEILLAMSIMVLLSLGLAAGLAAAVRAWESGERRLEVYQSKRIVHERLAGEISNAIHQRGQEEEEDRFEMIFNGESDELSLVTTEPSIMSPGLPMGLKEVNISVVPGDGLILQESMFSTSDFFNSERGEVYILDDHVTDIQFRYLYMPRPRKSLPYDEIEVEWLDNWGPEHIEIEETVEEIDDETRVREREIKTRLPVAVEVTLTVYDPNTDSDETWAPFLIPLKEARTLGLSVKRRPR